MKTVITDAELISELKTLFDLEESPFRGSHVSESTFFISENHMSEKMIIEALFSFAFGKTFHKCYIKYHEKPHLFTVFEVCKGKTPPPDWTEEDFDKLITEEYFPVRKA